MVRPELVSVLWQAGYVLVFAAAALVCFAGMYQSLRIKDTQTRWGVLSLLVFGGIWGSLHVLYLVTISRRVQYLWLVLAMIAGLCVLVSWLYMCVAYTRRSFHRDATVRALVLVLLAGLVLSLITNPIHDLWFATTPVEVPFTRRAIVPTAWATGLLLAAYGLAAAGAALLIGRFREVEYETTPLIAIVGLAFLPAVLDIASGVTPLVLPLAYAPLGVPIFAIGALFRYLEPFQIVQLTGHIDRPILIVDVDRTVRHANGPAVELLAGIDHGRGEPLEAIAPAIAAAIDGPDDVVALDGPTGERSYRVTENPFASDATHLGRMITLTDVTDDRETSR